MINAERVLLLVSTTIFLCYISGILYNRTKIPDIIWLLGFGILLGPVLNVFKPDLFQEIFPLMILVTVILFSFDSGINVNLQAMMGSMGKALALAIASFLSVTLSVWAALSLLMPETFTSSEGLLLGAMIGGIGGISVSGILGSLESLLGDIDGAGVLLMVESTLGPPIQVAAVVTMIQMAMLTGVPLGEGARDILYTFTASVVLGAVIGLGWAEMLNRLRERPLNYMMTIAALFPSHLIAETLAGAGGGPIAIVVFGVVLMNYGYVTRRLGLSRKVRIDRKMIREYQDEITFLIKSLFFVYLGLIATVSREYALIGLGIVALTLAVRYCVATGLGRLLGFTRPETVVSRLIFVQGAGALVLSQLPHSYDTQRLFFQNPDIFTNICIPIVLSSLLFSAVIAPQIIRRQLGKTPET